MSGKVLWAAVASTEPTLRSTSCPQSPASSPQRRVPGSQAEDPPYVPACTRLTPAASMALAAAGGTATASQYLTCAFR
ncbi:hypothetical protein JEQ12_011781 [Ovis aries]|uniref:Uncharacterized protein n=1 Tax=Ovis aries TaxID=9940 RepID=A0A835ZWK2_SHEEP|nr:hypothetical protein JEQ12_011781 [Ovis aries]